MGKCLKLRNRIAGMAGASEDKGDGSKKRKLEEVQDYYGKVLEKSDDLQTNACTSCAEPPEFVKAAIKNVHAEVLSKYYGCGLVVPDCVTGLRVLDLGCGSGRDCFVLSQLVGETGKVTG